MPFKINYKELIKESLNDDFYSVDSLENAKFTCYISAMKLKLAKLNTSKSKKQYDILVQMEQRVERYELKSIVNRFQAKLIRRQNDQIFALEHENDKLKKLLNNLENDE